MKIIEKITQSILFKDLVTKINSLIDNTNEVGSKVEFLEAIDTSKFEYLDRLEDIDSKASKDELNTSVSSHNTGTSSHEDIRLLIRGLTTRLNALADSDDTTLDQMSEVVAYIKANKTLIENVTTNKVNVSDIVNNLLTNTTNKPLSAAQGVLLKQLIDALYEAKNSGELDGHTPVRGVDYWTPDDVEQINTDSETFIIGELTKRSQLRPEFAQVAEELVDTSKLYVMPDGYIYAYGYTTRVEGGFTNLSDPTDENWKNNYRFGSGGEAEQAGTTITNEVACVKGDVIRLSGTTLRVNEDRIAVSVLRADNGEESVFYGYFNVGIVVNNVNIVTYNGLEDGVYKFTVSETYAGTVNGIRFAVPTPSDANLVVITVNEEIEDPEIVRDYSWRNTNHAFVPNEYDEEFVEVNEEIDQLKLDVVDLRNTNQQLENSIGLMEDKIDKVGLTEIPEYWRDHIAEKIATIKNLHKQYGKDCFSFVLISDSHYPSNLGKVSPALARVIMDESNIKYAIHVGDWQTRGCKQSKALLLEENDDIETMFAPIQSRLLMQQGNHDGSYGFADRDGDGAYSNTNSDGTIKDIPDRESYVHNLTHQEFHEFTYRKVGMVGNVHFDDTGTAYYIDDASNNVRYIGLNTQCNDYVLRDDGTQMYPKMWIMRFTQSQFDFLINEALVENVNNKTKIVVFAHVPTTQELGDGDIMNGVLNAFKNRTSYSGSYGGEYDYDAVSVDVDFTNAKGTLVGYFHGHTHVDSVDASNSFKLIGTRCDAAEENNSTLKAERIAGTITEQSFDVFTVTNDKIYATKIGAGANREIYY